MPPCSKDFRGCPLQPLAQNGHEIDRKTGRCSAGALKQAGDYEARRVEAGVTASFSSVVADTRGGTRCGRSSQH